MSQHNVNVLNRLFSRNTLRHFINERSENIYTSLVENYVDNPTTLNNSEIISEIYSELKKNYRNEYYYKNTLLNKLLLGIHSVRTTTALTELPIARSKADFILINGKAVVYEIKTELDNFDRLESQLTDYYKAFDHVVVVTCSENLPTLKKRLENVIYPVGIYILNKKGKLSIIRKPEKYDRNIDLEIIFKLLRKSEYELVLQEVYGYLPDVTQFKYYTECKKMFLKIPNIEAYEMVLKLLKKRSVILKDEFTRVPYELKFLAYFMDLSNEEYKKLDVFLHQNYKEA